MLNILCTHTDGHFVDMMGCENTNHNIKEKHAGNTVLCRASGVCSPEHGVAWELYLSLSCIRGEHHTPELAPKRIKLHNSKSGFYPCMWLSLPLELNHHASGTICLKKACAMLM